MANYPYVQPYPAQPMQVGTAAFNPYPQMPMPQQPIQQTQMPVQNQNGGFVTVRSEEEARNYPVGYGNSVKFKDENAPYIYEKIMGLSQFEKPVFKKYRLVEEDSPEVTEAPKNDILEDSKYDELKSDIKDLRSQLNNVRNKLNSLSPKEKGGDTK